MRNGSAPSRVCWGARGWGAPGGRGWGGPPRPPPPPSTRCGAPPRTVRWTRSGWTAHGHLGVVLPIGNALAHLTVELRGPWPLLVRAMLVVLYDVLLLVLAWGIGGVVAEGWSPTWPIPRGAL